MKIVLLTARLHAPGLIDLCETFHAHEVDVVEVVCARDPSDGLLAHRLANTPAVRRLACKLRGESDLEPAADTETYFRSRAIAFRFFAGRFQDKSVVGHLKRSSPDLLINYRGPIFRRATIETARVGLLNCHAALLPEFRGMNVAEWSVLHNFPTGNTVHLIDAGIDTGAILAFYPVPVEDCSTVEALRTKLSDRNAEHLARTARMMKDGAVEKHPQKQKAGRQYFRMHDALKQTVEEKLRAGYRPTVSVGDRPYIAGEKRPP